MSEELINPFQGLPLETDHSDLSSLLDNKGGENFQDSKETAGLLKSILEWAVELLDVESGEIYFYDNRTQSLKLSVVCGSMKTYYGMTLQPNEGLAGKVFTSGKPILVNDYNHWGGKTSKALDESPFQTELAIPLQSNGRIIGVFIIIANFRKRPISEADIRPMVLCANLVAAAIENARLYQELQNSLYRFKRTLEQEVADRTNEISQAVLAAQIGSAQSSAFSDLNTDALLSQIIELRTTKKVLTKLTQRSLETSSIHELTPREIQVLKLIGQGYSNKEIASDLNLAVSTIKFHVGSLLNKLNLPDRTQAALWSVHMGLVKPGTDESQEPAADSPKR